MEGPGFVEEIDYHELKFIQVKPLFLAYNRSFRVLSPTVKFVTSK